MTHSVGNNNLCLLAAVCLSIVAMPSYGQRPQNPEASPFDKTDTNGDGKLSRTEFKGPARVFVDMDSNKDGFVSRDEARSFAESRNSAKGPRHEQVTEQAEAYPDLEILKYDKAKTFPGNVIFVDKLANRVVEATVQGKVVWECAGPQMCSINPAMQGACGTKLMDVELLPNNNLLVLNGGNGVYEINRDGKVIWQYLNDTVSHDADRLKNGNTLMACVGAEANAEFPYTKPQAIEVNTQGKIVWEWHAKDDYANSKYKNVRSGDAKDWTHMNSVQRLPDGNTLLSVRNWNLLVAVDKNGKTVWTTGAKEVPVPGTFGKESPQCPHTPVMLDDDIIIVSESVKGSVIEWSRKQKGVVWRYPEKAGMRRDDWLFIRAAHRLPNGNTFIIDSRGQFLEVTHAGEIVWQARLKNFKDLRPGKDKAIPQESPCFNADRRGMPYYGGR
ncbi:MAG: aryl-sulfate sulfotransferase [Acidobacteria bacterium]|nr:aryl-sulfate sulfotransferase [Acidobacteriota bacterium]